MLYGVILAGGRGTRLWPESRKNCPKQFICFDGQATGLSQAISRFQPLIPLKSILVVTQKDMVGQVHHEKNGILSKNILAESIPRNTLPAIGFAAVTLFEEDKEAIMVVVPSDHKIEPLSKFQELIRQATLLLQEDRRRIVTLGIKPSRPATEYGYLQVGTSIPSIKNAYHLDAFHEKPHREKAMDYLEKGGYLWNAGIFIGYASRFLELIQQFQPEIARGLNRIRDIQAEKRLLTETSDELFFKTLENRFKEVYQAFPSISIDYGIMENATDLVTIAADLEWKDIGSFDALRTITDSKGNSVSGVQFVALDAQNNTVRWNSKSVGDSDELLAIVGLDNVEVIRYGNATLITKRGNDAKISELIQILRSKKLDDFI